MTYRHLHFITFKSYLYSACIGTKITNFTTQPLTNIGYGLRIKTHFLRTNFYFLFFLISQERGVGAFPPNFVVTTMMDVAAVRAHDKNPIMCSSCEDKLPAAARCIECMDFLCHDCRNAHMRLRLTKTHRVRFKSLSYKIHYDEERKRGQGSLASHGRIFLIYKVYITLHRPMKVPPPPISPPLVYGHQLLTGSGRISPSRL